MSDINLEIKNITYLYNYSEFEFKDVYRILQYRNDSTGRPFFVMKNWRYLSNFTSYEDSIQYILEDKKVPFDMCLENVWEIIL